MTDMQCVTARAALVAKVGVEKCIDAPVAVCYMAASMCVHNGCKR
jgi:hypothetical protein